MTFVSSFPNEALDENVRHIEVFPRLKVKGCSYDFGILFMCFTQRSFYFLHSPFLEFSRQLTLFLLDFIHVFERLLKACFKSIQEFF
jgi:hypothetical protein